MVANYFYKMATKKRPQELAMKPIMKVEKIRALLIENKVTQTAIAKELGLTPGSINRVISGHYTSKRVQEAVSRATRVPFEKMWGKAA
jgi:transcriptional regulator with XRE-family HTH domain